MCQCLIAYNWQINMSFNQQVTICFKLCFKVCNTCLNVIKDAMTVPEYSYLTVTSIWVILTFSLMFFPTQKNMESVIQICLQEGLIETYVEVSFLWFGIWEWTFVHPLHQWFQRVTFKTEEVCCIKDIQFILWIGLSLNILNFALTKAIISYT